MGLKPVRSDRGQGFALERTDVAEVKEAPYLAKSGRVKYDAATKDLIAAKDDEEGVQIWVPEDQSGLRRAFRGRGGSIYFWNGRLLCSNADGRVPVIQDPKGRAENLDSLIKQFTEEDLKLATEMNARRERALHVYRTGKF